MPGPIASLNASVAVAIALYEAVRQRGHARDRRTPAPTRLRCAHGPHREVNGPVTTVILSRPERRNAVDRDTADALVAAFDAFERDDAAHVAVLWGEGGTFCAGADLVAVSEGRPNRVEPDGPRPDGADAHDARRSPSSPPSPGTPSPGGLELALWCDLRVAEEDAVFGVFCRRWGVPLIDGGTVRLPRLVGASRALDMILTGRARRRARGARRGASPTASSPDGAARAGGRVARRRASRASRSGACAPTARSALEQWSLPLDAAIAREFALGVATIASGETVEGAPRASPAAPAGTASSRADAGDRSPVRLRAGAGSCACAFSASRRCRDERRRRTGPCPCSARRAARRRTAGSASRRR